MKDMRQYIIAKGAKIVDRVQVTKLMKAEDGAISSVVGFNIRTGEEVNVQAKVAILAAGDAAIGGRFSDRMWFQVKGSV